MPDVRALRSVQQQVVVDVRQIRHFENLIEEPWCRVAINGVFSCSQQYVEQQQELATLAAPEAKRRQARLQAKNTVCLCNSVCPDETRSWLRCVKRATKPNGTTESCEADRRRLELCTHGGVSRLLHGLMLPHDKASELSHL